MSKAGAPEKLIVNGKRLDGRNLDEFRTLDAKIGVLKSSQGSGEFSFGDTKAVAGAFGPRQMHPRKLQNVERATVRCKYFMAPFSTEDRIRPGHSRRGTEISKVISEAFTASVFTENFRKSAIDVFISIVQASASTRCAGLNAACLALVDAGIPMKDLVTSVAVGKVDDTLVLDVGKAEDNYGQVDFALSTIGGSDRFVHMQMDGIVTREEFSKLLEMGEKGCKQVYDKLKQTIREKYSMGVGTDE